MENQQATELLEKYEQGLCTPQERAIVETWFTKELAKHNLVSADIDYESKEAEIYRNLPHFAKYRHLRPRLIAAVAASVLILLTAGFYFFTTYTTRQEQERAIAQLKPGSDKAILTLSDGKKIVLNDSGNGTLSEKKNVRIIKNKSGDISFQNTGSGTPGQEAASNTLSIPRGGQWHIVLADGTHVWLNSASSLTFPDVFNGARREVFLSGEASFEVAADKQHPFIVHSRLQETEVLGTHFNINSYIDEPFVVTTVMSGKVRVSGGRGSLVLNPDEQCLSSGETFHSRTVKAEDAVAWRYNLFQFSGADIYTVMRQFARWYDVDVEFRGRFQKNQFTGRISRGVAASEVFGMLRRYGITVKVENRKVIVSGAE